MREDPASARRLPQHLRLLPAGLCFHPCHRPCLHPPLAPCFPTPALHSWLRTRLVTPWPPRPGEGTVLEQGRPQCRGLGIGRPAPPTEAVRESGAERLIAAVLFAHVAINTVREEAQPWAELSRRVSPPFW